MKILKFSLYILLIATVLYSCRKEDTVTEQPKPGGDTTITTDSTVNESTILALVNNVRKTGCTCGTTAMPAVAPVTWNSLLEKAALLHSTDMNKNNYFSHTGLDGSTPGDRITRVGYSWRAYGENIAKGYTSEQAVMTGWLKSEGHCKNIMSSNVKEMGVGRDGNYWTQVFASK
ncbi:MAG TPA: CAP domain-containing protein [Niastella sp.]